MNFRRVLSKSSLRSSTSSGKSLNKVDEIKKLKEETESLKLNVSSLNVLLENRDAAIGKLAREKEKLYVEVKSLQRINRNIQQEVIDEREMHVKEKTILINNMKMKIIPKKLSNSSISDTILNEEEYISALQNEIKSKDDVIYNICNKYLKLKKRKEELQKKFLTLQKYAQETFESIITSLEDNKHSLDVLLDELRKSAKINPSHKKYIKLLQINADLNFENTQLKLRLIPSIELDSSSNKKEIEDFVVAVPELPQSNDQYANDSRRQKSSHRIEQLFQDSNSRSSKIVGVINRLKNINIFSKRNRTIRYRSMSDTLLPRNFYK